GTPAIARFRRTPRRRFCVSSAATSTAAPLTAASGGAASPRRNRSPMSVRLDHGTDELGELHEINVTPFIDVMLVLLIIFMIAAPLATVDIAVDLPASTAQQSPRPDKPLFVTLKPDTSLLVGDDSVAREALA